MEGATSNFVGGSWCGQTTEGQHETDYANGTESRGRPTRQTAWWESVTDHPSRMKGQVKYSAGSWEKFPDQ